VASSLDDQATNSIHFWWLDCAAFGWLQLPLYATFIIFNHLYQAALPLARGKHVENYLPRMKIAVIW